MINIFSIALAANESREVALAGEYFEIRSAVYPITKIELTDRSGGLVSVIDAAMESDFVRPGRYETMRITNGATAQIVSFWYGSGDAGSRRFSGNVTGTVALDVATLAALEALDINPATLNTITRPLLPASHWSDASTLVANTPLTVFNAAANVNGAIIHSADAQDIASASFQQTFLAKATAPAGIADGAIIAMSKYWPISGNNVQNLTMQTPTRIAAGLGLYFISSLAGAANMLRTCRYTLL